MTRADDKVDVIVLVSTDADLPDAGLLARRLARVVIGGSERPTYRALSASASP